MAVGVQEVWQGGGALGAPVAFLPDQAHLVGARGGIAAGAEVDGAGFIGSSIVNLLADAASWPPPTCWAPAGSVPWPPRQAPERPSRSSVMARSGCWPCWPPSSSAR